MIVCPNCMRCEANVNKNLTAPVLNGHIFHSYYFDALMHDEYACWFLRNIWWICLLCLPCIENANLIALHTASMHLFAVGNFDGVHRISNNQVNKQFKPRHSLHFPLAAVSCVVNSFQLVHAFMYMHSKHWWFSFSWHLFRYNFFSCCWHILV